MAFKFFFFILQTEDGIIRIYKTFSHSLPCTRDRDRRREREREVKIDFNSPFGK